MKELVKMVGVLTLISALAGGLLAISNSMTREPIAQSLRAEKLAAMRQILPEYDNDPMADACILQDDGCEWVFYVARKQGEFVGAAFESVSDQGYSGAIRIMAGVAADDTVRGVEIIEQLETPGLGAKITESGFKDQFKNRGIASTKWAVTKDGGDIAAITGATISPRAVVAALKKGLDVYQRHKDKIINAPQPLDGKAGNE